jgi:hypothetical protein
MMRTVPRVLRTPERITIIMERMSPEDFIIPGTVRNPTPIIELIRSRRPLVRLA